MAIISGINITGIRILDTQSYDVNYLVVAGGGGGGAGGGFGPNPGAGGGGGAGGYVEGNIRLTFNEPYTVIVGAGGVSDSIGANSSVIGAGLTRIGRGGGQGGYGTSFSRGSGGAGGSGGGGASTNAQTAAGGASNQFPTLGYGNGNPGGGGQDTSGSSGGGAGAAGTSAGPILTPAVLGGAGKTWINGVTYAAGGNSATPNIPGSSGAVNTGRGGAGGGYTGNPAPATGGGSGGSGIVIFGYSGTQRGSGGNVSSAGGNTYHTFTSSGTYIA